MKTTVTDRVIYPLERPCTIDLVQFQHGISSSD